MIKFYSKPIVRNVFDYRLSSRYTVTSLLHPLIAILNHSPMQHHPFSPLPRGTPTSWTTSQVPLPVLLALAPFARSRCSPAYFPSPARLLRGSFVPPRRCYFASISPASLLLLTGKKKQPRGISPRTHHHCVAKLRTPRRI